MTDEELQAIRERHSKASPWKLHLQKATLEDGTTKKLGASLSFEDCAFYSLAYTDVPALLAEVERLRAGASVVVAAFDEAAGEKYDELAWQRFVERGGVGPIRARGES